LRRGDFANPKHFLGNFNLIEKFRGQGGIVCIQRIAWMKKTKLLLLGNRRPEEGEVVV
jgi:hypothetical protein